ncbi:MAG: hypothetical protein R2853_04640 [Thermomicrobiales bacterium]|nr:hypothetical protein [Thermomicrobiales bacterium]
MSPDLALQLLGAVLIVSAFALSQTGRLDARSSLYIMLNLVGGAILAVLAYQQARWGFVLLESTWTLISLISLIMKSQGREISASH